MFRDVGLDDYIIDRNEDGWYRVNLKYFDEHPELFSSVSARMKVCDFADRTIRHRNRALNFRGRLIQEAPRKGVAVRHPSNRYYLDWLNHLRDKYYEYFGDVQELPPNASANEIDSYVMSMHEKFQMSKMGIFAPYERKSLTRSVDDFISTAQEDNQENIPLDNVDILLEAMDLVRKEDLAGIEDGSLRVTSFREALYGSNAQGLATGLIQLSRDKELSKEQSSQLNKVYGFNFREGENVGEAIIRLAESKNIPFDLSHNIVTNLKRVQVGGVDLSKLGDNDRITEKNVRDAKYRTINANDPLCQIHQASAAIAFRDAIINKTSGSFYNTLYDPDSRWYKLENMTRTANKHSATHFPFDYSKHDAHLHADWIMNIMQRIVKPKFHPDDQWVIDLSAICLVFKMILQPVGVSGYKITGLVGALGSGDPWTNILGTLGTRTIGRLLALARPDIFVCNEYIGCNNGDDAAYGVFKTAIKSYGIENIIKIANDIVNSVHYYFNDSKLLIIPIPGQELVNHWEQYAIWYNTESDKVQRHGSTLRYFGKVYSDEDPGRQGALEGLMDQLSSLNNTVGYVGDETFTTNSFNLEILADFIDRDKVLIDYIEKHGLSFFARLAKDAESNILDKLREHNNTLPLDKRKSNEELVKTAKNKLAHHLRASGFDKSGIARAIHTQDFSFLSITKLAGLGSAKLRSIAEIGKGRILNYRATNDTVEWLNLNAS